MTLVSSAELGASDDGVMGTSLSISNTQGLYIPHPLEIPVGRVEKYILPCL